MGNKFFNHDCANCVYLGAYEHQDLYFHKGSEDLRDTVIARFGNESHEYESGLAHSFGANPALTHARLVAQLKGMLDYPFFTALHSIYASSPVSVLREFSLECERHPIGRVALSLLDNRFDAAAYAEVYASYGEDAAGLVQRACEGLCHARQCVLRLPQLLPLYEWEQGQVSEAQEKQGQ